MLALVAALATRGHGAARRDQRRQPRGRLRRADAGTGGPRHDRAARPSWTAKARSARPTPPSSSGTCSTRSAICWCSASASTRRWASPPALPGVDYNAFFLAGVLGMASFGIASNTSWSFFLDRDNGIFYEMLTYPLSRSQYLLGKVLFNVLRRARAGARHGRPVGGAARRAAAARAACRCCSSPRSSARPAGSSSTPSSRCASGATTRSTRSRRSSTSCSCSRARCSTRSSRCRAAFRVVALANPITWHVDVLRYATIGIGDGRLIVWESIAFIAFTLVAFLVAVRSLEREG